MLVNSLIKAVLGYFILMLISTNLIGFIVRQILKPGITDDLKRLKVEVRPDLKAIDIIISIVFTLTSVAYFIALYYYFNIGVLIAAAILMVSRLPDLLFEIKMGEKINFKNMPKTPFDIFMNIISWLALPLLWYSFYIIQNPNSFF